ncbi:TetR/AcrR family transcriptional regulator [Mycobacterium sp. DL592]|uniref:TetR/AcrR family transcriptional regulator n=1 Tax=Mycobacterium sp. DL592 TaxID=2675524 RepID=UPI00141E2DA8|nr:TetR/AcrR family transcriptional regulator [Mycobacterium sp. DL592]
MVRPAQTARSERTRDALRRAAMVRFLAQGVEDTSADQIAADAGVSLRTFYRHFTSKHDLLFADYDAGLEWFRAALQARSPEEPILESVQSAIDASPYDPEAVAQIAALRAKELDPGSIVRHTRQVEAEFADAVAAQLADSAEHLGVDDRLRVMVTARCIAAAVFGAMEMWMVGDDQSLAELQRLCRTALELLRGGVITD